MASNKQYGLILPKKQPKIITNVSNVFDDDASDGEKNKMKKQTKFNIQKALDEDPTIYQYDEIYDDMKDTKSQSDIKKCKDRTPKYIENLLKTAERRKKEQEHRIERMVQKEREAEGEMYADKESFVTSAYRAKLEEFKKMEEEEARMSRLEAIGDVTKQQDMSGFYRHLYEQTVNYQDQTNDNGNNKTKEKNNELEEKKNLASNTNEIKENMRVDKIINRIDDKTKVTTKKSRQYRQRAIETYESDSEAEVSKEELKKDQIVTPSISEDIDKSEIQEPEKKKQKQDANDVEITKCIADVKNKDSNVADTEKSQNNKTSVSESEKIVHKEKPVEKKDKSIWEKRTVGPIFEAALQRYYTRKAMRQAVV